MAGAEGAARSDLAGCEELNERHLWHSDVMAYRSGTWPWVVDWCVKCGEDHPDMPLHGTRRRKGRWRRVENVKPAQEAEGLL